MELTLSRNLRFSIVDKMFDKERAHTEDNIVIPKVDFDRPVSIFEKS